MKVAGILLVVGLLMIVPWSFAEDSSSSESRPLPAYVDQQNVSLDPSHLLEAVRADETLVLPTLYGEVHFPDVVLVSEERPVTNIENGRAVTTQRTGNIYEAESPGGGKQ